MPQTIIVDPHKLRQFDEPEDATFCLVTNPEFKDDITIHISGSYRDYLTV